MPWVTALDGGHGVATTLALFGAGCEPSAARKACVAFHFARAGARQTIASKRVDLAGRDEELGGRVEPVERFLETLTLLQERIARAARR